MNLMLGLALFASISNGFASDDVKARRAAIEKAIANEQPLHRQIQLAIFDAFEARENGLNGSEFYQRHNFVPEKFIKLVCERNFTGAEALKELDKSIESLKKRRQSYLMRWIDEQQGDNNPRRIKIYEKGTDAVRAKIRAIKEWKNNLSNPDKVFPTNPASKYFTAELGSLTEAGTGALGLAPADHMGAIDLLALKKNLYDKGLDAGSSPLYRKGGDLKEFATFYAEVRFHYAMKDGMHPRSITRAQTQVITLWNKSGHNLAKARSLFKKSK